MAGFDQAYLSFFPPKIEPGFQEDGQHETCCEECVGENRPIRRDYYPWKKDAIYQNTTSEKNFSEYEQPDRYFGFTHQAPSSPLAIFHQKPRYCVRVIGRGGVMISFS